MSPCYSVRLRAEDPAPSVSIASLLIHSPAAMRGQFVLSVLQCEQRRPAEICARDRPMTNHSSAHIDRRRPPRSTEEALMRALANPEAARQLREALEEERRGLPPTPLREVQAEARRRSVARERAQRSA